MKFFKGPGLLLLVFLAVWVLVAEIDAQSPDVKRRYMHFLTQHRDNTNDVKKDYCDKKMRERGMTKPKCKAKNSFVHTSDDNLKAMCGDKGVPDGKYRLACVAYRVTTCVLKGGSTKPPCKYKQDNRPRYVRIACEEGFPVHLEEGKVLTEKPKQCKK